MIKFTITDHADDQFVSCGRDYLVDIGEGLQLQETCKTSLEAYMNASYQAFIDSFDAHDHDTSYVADEDWNKYEAIVEMIDNHFQIALEMLAKIKTK